MRFSIEQKILTCHDQLQRTGAMWMYVAALFKKILSPVGLIKKQRHSAKLHFILCWSSYSIFEREKKENSFMYSSYTGLFGLDFNSFMSFKKQFSGTRKFQIKHSGNTVIPGNKTAREDTSGNRENFFSVCCRHLEKNLLCSYYFPLHRSLAAALSQPRRSLVAAYMFYLSTYLQVSKVGSKWVTARHSAAQPRRSPAAASSQPRHRK